MNKVWRTALAAAGLLLPASAASAQDVKVVVVGPMSGQFASFWPQIEPAGRAAMDFINKAGGIGGRRIALSFADDACDPRQAVSVANKNVQDKVDVVIGHFCSGSSISASEVYNEAGVMMISGASVASRLTQRGMPLVFRTVGRDDQQGAVIAGHLATGKYGQKIAVVHDKSAFGKGLADNVERYLGRANIMATLADSVTAGENDYSALVTKLMGRGIEAIFFGGYHREAGLIIRQARQAGFKGTFLSGDGLKTQEYWSIAGDAGEGTLFAFFPDARVRPEAEPALAALKALNSSGEGFTLYIFAAIEAYAKAASAAGGVEPNRVATALRAKPVQTVVGDLRFNDKGDVDRNLYGLYRWTKGQYLLVDSTSFSAD